MFALSVLTGCDGKDPERLQKVARKLNEKARKSTEDVNLPRITITMPERKKTDEEKPPVANIEKN
jgi:hypothetical protein